MGYSIYLIISYTQHITVYAQNILTAYAQHNILYMYKATAYA